MDRRVKAIAHGDAVCKLFMTVPGVGYIAALTFKAAVDTPERFKRSKTVAAHFGPNTAAVPNPVSATTRDISRKRATRRCAQTLYAAANITMMPAGKPCELKSWGYRLMKSKGRKARGRCCSSQARRHSAHHVE